MLKKKWGILLGTLFISQLSFGQALVKAGEGAQAFAKLITRSSKESSVVSNFAKELGISSEVLKGKTQSELVRLYKSVPNTRSLDALVNGHAGEGNYAQEYEAFRKTKNDFAEIAKPSKKPHAVSHDVITSPENQRIAYEVAQHTGAGSGLRRALVDSLKISADLQRSLAKQGVNIARTDSRVLCEGLTDLQAIKAKTAVETDILAVSESGGIKSVDDFVETYAAELAQEVQSNRPDGLRRVKELSKPKEEGGNCEFFPRNVYLSATKLIGSGLN